MKFRDLTEIGEAVKTKNVKAIKSNPKFVVQTAVSLLILTACIVMLFYDKFKDQQTILWSTISGILSSYVPTAGFDKPHPPTPQPIPEIPTLRERGKKTEFKDEDYDCSSSYCSAMNPNSSY
jgi:hypothetical protein